ncbi:MAG TPA: hypothetical protein VLJ79_02905 [Candidatus Binatia bacterium]|nr:hypothetical protein [Candidatus Binatia bacterium]
MASQARGSITEMPKSATWPGLKLGIFPAKHVLSVDEGTQSMS